MAKETKKEEKKATPVATVDNIEEVINAGTKVSPDLGKEVLDLIEKEKNDEIKYQMKQRIYYTRYNVDRKLLALRTERKKAESKKIDLGIASRMARLLSGYDVTEEIIKYAVTTKDDLFKIEEANEKDKTITITSPTDGSKTTYKVGEHIPSVIDIVDFDEMKHKLNDDSAKRFREIDNEHDKLEKKNQLRYGEYYNNSWRC